MKSSPLILMYHGIKNGSQSVPRGREIGAELYDVSLEKFKSQMVWLKDNGYCTIAIDELDKLSEAKQIVLTFDDGEMNNFTYAFPVLKQLNLKAYFFVIIERIGKPGYMGWNELHQIQEAGMIIGSHSLTHPILTDLTDHQVEEELHGSLQYLVSSLGNQVNTLSIPRGFCDDRVIQIAYKAGYQNIFISERPENLNSRCWERIAVKTSWDIQRFEKAIKDEKPMSERILDQVKRMVKKYLRGGFYNRLRSAMIKISYSNK